MMPVGVMTYIVPSTTIGVTSSDGGRCDIADMSGMPDMSAMSHRPPSLEVTPIVVDGTMYVITPTGIIGALDPATGTERWRYDAGVNPHRGYGDFASRGVSFWLDSRAAPGATCGRRIF